MPQQIYKADPYAIEKYSTQFSRFENDYVFSRVSKTERFTEFTTHAMRLGGMTIVLCLKGSVELDVNLETYTLKSNDLIITGPDAVIAVRNVDWDNLDAYVFLISPDFIRDINFELNMVAAMNFTSRQPPLISLNSEEVKLMSRYFDLIHFNTVENSDARYVRSISRSLIAAAVYQLMQFHAVRTDLRTRPALSRRAGYVQEFLQLVNQYHRRERSVAFYASKLFISAKYLSLIIKESTGKSAAEWIDEYVILEAKNLLRFSGKNVQQIAYELNFSNQSSFGKYFKHLTGMSPTKFQRS